MEAAVLTSHGSAPELISCAEPVGQDGWSIIDVTAAPIVPLDLFCAGGASYFGPPALPYIPGVQGVGLIARSQTYEPGTRVFFSTNAGMAAGDGSLAQHCAVPDADVVPIVSTIADSAVAALGLSAVAAWMALSWRANLASGETVVILGAGGAVGQAAVGAARALGAGRVVAVCRSASSADRATRAGADRVVVITSPPDPDTMAAELRAACDGGADVVLDAVFGDVASVACSVLAPWGRLVNLGGTGGDTATFSSSLLRSRSISVLGYTNNALRPEQRAKALAAVLVQADDGRIAVEHQTVPLTECTAGWRAAVAGGPRVVLLPEQKLRDRD